MIGCQLVEGQRFGAACQESAVSDQRIGEVRLCRSVGGKRQIAGIRSINNDLTRPQQSFDNAGNGFA